MTVKEIIMGQHNQIAQLNDKIIELEKKMAVIEQKANVCDLSSHSTEQTLKEHTQVLNSLKGMGTLLMAITGLIAGIAIFAGQAWVQLAIVHHEKTTVHYKDYLKYPEHIPAPK